jgi:uncharacterized protein (DUF2236 family)
MVSEHDLESRLAEVRAQASGAKQGVFGPNSVTWKVNREAALFLGAGRALLLQLAHPWVAQAITDHSTTITDPIRRFHRTFDLMFTLVFGTLDQACAAARRLHKRHSVITGMMPRAAGPFAAGSFYLADEAAALMWVHATLIDTALAAHDALLGPLEPAERDRYYEESKLMAAMYGIPQEMVPGGWTEFQAYMNAALASPVLTVTSEARSIAHTLVIEGARPWLRPPRWYRAVTAGMLPEQLREAFGLRFEDVERRAASRALQRIRRIYPRLSKRLKHVGPYWEASERLARGGGPSFRTRASNWVWIGRSSIERVDLE